MTDQPKKIITRDQYLQALGLFTLARYHSSKSDEFYKALKRHLGDCDDGWLSDAIWAGDGDPSFDEALERAGFVVAPPPTTPAGG